MYLAPASLQSLPTKTFAIHVQPNFCGLARTNSGRLRSVLSPRKGDKPHFILYISQNPIIFKDARLLSIQNRPSTNVPLQPNCDTIQVSPPSVCPLPLVLLVIFGNPQHLQLELHRTRRSLAVLTMVSLLTNRPSDRRNPNGYARRPPIANKGLGVALAFARWGMYTQSTFSAKCFMF